MPTPTPFVFIFFVFCGKVWLCASCATLSYCDRVNISCASPLWRNGVVSVELERGEGILPGCGTKEGREFVENVACPLKTSPMTSLPSRPLVIEMSKEFGWGMKEKSDVLGIFFYGYVLSQVFSAILARKFGTRMVLIPTYLWPLYRIFPSLYLTVSSSFTLKSHLCTLSYY
jgi:hypothetical protein